MRVLQASNIYGVGFGIPSISTRPNSSYHRHATIATGTTNFIFVASLLFNELIKQLIRNVVEF